MDIAKIYNKLIKEDGFVLIDANNKKNVIGKPIKENPIILRLLDKKLNYKLIFSPDLYFGEAYTNGSLKIENGNLTEFLDIMFKNFGRAEINNFLPRSRQQITIFFGVCFIKKYVLIKGPTASNLN